MNDTKIQSNGTCTTAEANDHDYDPHHDRDPNSSDKGNMLAMSVNDLYSGEHLVAKVMDDFGDCSQDSKDSNHLTSGDIVRVDANMLPSQSEGTEVEKLGLVDSSSFPTPIEPSPSMVSGTEKPPATTTKGYGLKKWRRIRREMNKDATISPDPTKLLKRGSANILDAGQPSDGYGSVSSTNALVQSLGGTDQFTFPGSGSSCRLAVDTVFSAGVDSDNSDDRSSKSSTAASAPKYRYDTLRVVGQPREKHRVKNLSGKNLSSIGVGPTSQAGKGPADTSKKPRGESINLEKENSLSSMESDSRSCNSVFIRGTSSVISDQAQSGRPVNSDGEDANDEPAGCNDNVGLSQDNMCNANKGNSKHHQLLRDCDPLVNSIQMLQSAQAALEREVQKFGEIGKGIHSLCDDSSKNIGSTAYSMSLGLEVCKDRPSDGWASEFNNIYLNKNVQTLERQLSEAEGRLKEKELRILEHEATINSMESAHDSLFKQKVEAEVEYLVITRSNKDLSVLVKDQIKLLMEQKSVASKQAQSLGMMTDVENKAIILQEQAEQLDALHKEMEGSENILKMQRRVVKFTKCLFMQLILLVLVFGLFILQLLPKSAVVVPT